MTRKRKEKETVLCRQENYKILLKESQFIAWIKKLKKATMFAFNTTANSLNSVSADLIGLSFAIEPGVAVYVPIADNCLIHSEQISYDRALELLKPLLEDEKISKIGQNLKFDRGILQNYGIELHGIIFDTMLESYILNSSARYHDIDSLSARWLENKDTFFKKTVSKIKNQLCFQQKQYIKPWYCAVKNVDITLQLHLKMWPKIQQNNNLLNIFQHIEMPLVPVLSRIERNGVKIDQMMLNRYSKEINLRLIELQKKAYDIVGKTFNLCSTKQIQALLFKEGMIKPLKKTPGGTLSTSEEVLETLVSHHPLPKIILEYRSLSKIKSTYTDKLPLMINPKTGRIHTSYNQAVTTTGRLSSTDPNLQNIPVRDRVGCRVRQAFIAPKNYMIVSADYSQIELRIMAHLSCDKGLLMAFAEGKDIHQATAAEMFSLPINSVTNEQRQSAKAINFGLIYGMTAFGLSRKLNIQRKESQRYINLYFKHYPKVQEYIEITRNYAKEKGYVETLDGRRLYLPDIKSRNLVLRANAERAAINAPVQGTAADIIKRAMIAVDMWLKTYQPRAQMIMQVHDELVFEVHKDDVITFSKRVHDIMKDSVKLNLPLPVKIRSGENWDQVY